MRGFGYECLHVGEIGKSTTPDEEILGLARAKDAVVVTLDADFHAILAVTGVARPSVIRLRIEGLQAREVAECVRVACARFEDELVAGCLVTVKKRKTTCHKLPIGGLR